MSIVPSTATATDANIERKKILDENALLIQMRDAMRTEHDLYAEALSAIKEKFIATTNVEVPINEMADFIRENFRKKKQELSSEISNHEKIRDIRKSEAETHSKALAKLEEKLKKKQDELARIEPIISERRNEMRREEQSHAEEVSRMQEINSKLKVENIKVAEDTNVKRQEIDKKMEFILREEKRLATKERDIQVYAQRILEMGKKVDPNFEMIL